MSVIHNEEQNYTPSEGTLLSMNFQFDFFPGSEAYICASAQDAHYQSCVIEFQSHVLDFFAQSNHVPSKYIGELTLKATTQSGDINKHNFRLSSEKEFEVLLWQAGFLNVSFFNNRNKALYSELNSYKSYRLPEQKLSALGFSFERWRWVLRHSETVIYAVRQLECGKVEFISQDETEPYPRDEIFAWSRREHMMLMDDDELTDEFIRLEESTNGQLTLCLHSDTALELVMHQMKWILPSLL